MPTDSRHNVEVDYTGWPAGLSETSKKWLTVSYATDKPADFKKWVLWDAIYCAVERALRVVADPKWTLKEKS